jgi:hypothetical protein
VSTFSVSIATNDQSSESGKLVTTEEVIIVSIVLIIWIAVILLFVRKWGKIRELEPYTPTFDRNASFSIPPPAPLSAMSKKACSESRDTLTSNSPQRRQQSDSQSDRFMLTMPGNGHRRTSASSPDVRFTHAKRTFPPHLPRLTERFSEDSEVIEQESLNAV